MGLRSGSTEVSSLYFYEASHHNDGGNSNSPDSQGNNRSSGLSEDQINKLAQDIATPIDHLFQDSNPLK
jgi:hypothetical protein